MNNLTNKQKAIDALERILNFCEPIDESLANDDPDRTGYDMFADYMIIRKYLYQTNNKDVSENQSTEKALRLITEWAVECDFGYDNIPEKYEKYKNEIQGMDYIEGLIHIAKMEVKNDK